MISFGVCELSMIPVRKSASETSEMVNQLLFGELVQILHDKDSWLLIKSTYDGYEGWIDKKMISIVEESEFNRLRDSEKKFITDITAKITVANSDYTIMMGSVIRGMAGNNFNIGDNNYTLDKELPSDRIEDKVSKLKDFANRYLNTPYLWGGRSPMGIDCSGFVQVVFRMIGIALNRDASQQAEQGITVNFIEEATTGDLVFFDNEELST